MGQGIMKGLKLQELPVAVGKVRGREPLLSDDRLLHLVACWMRLRRANRQQPEEQSWHLQHRENMRLAGLQYSPSIHRVLSQMHVRFKNYTRTNPRELRLNPPGTTKKQVLVWLFAFLRTVFMPRKPGTALTPNPKRKKQFALLGFSSFTNKWSPHFGRFTNGLLGETFSQPGFADLPTQNEIRVCFLFFFGLSTIMPTPNTIALCF